MGFNPFDWKNYDLKKIPGVGPVFKALNDPYKAAIHNASVALAGTPIGGAFQGLEKASSGNIRGAAKDYLTTIAHVTGVDNLPGVQAITNIATGIGSHVTSFSLKAAGGAGMPTIKIVPKNLDLLVSIMPAVPGGAPVTPVAPQRPIPAPAQVVSNALARSNVAPGPAWSAAKPQKRARPVRSFDPVEWATHASAKDTVGGTQPARGT